MSANIREVLLAQAEQLVNGDRNVDYGDPNADFERTADMWSAYLGHPVAKHDVAAMMCLLKISRIAWSADKWDSWVDLAGYAACGASCVFPDPSAVTPEPRQPPENVQWTGASPKAD